MAPQSQCPRRRSIGRLEQAVSNTVPRILDLFHLVPDPSGEWPGLGPRRYRRSTASGHRSASGRLLGLRLGRRRVLRRRRFWRRILRRRRFGGRRRSFGELVMQFSKEDHEAVSAAIQAAEKRTNGQIVCVLAHASSDYAYIPILWASALALVTPWPLINFTPWSVQRIFLIQLWSLSSPRLFSSWRRSGWRWFLAACAGRGRIVRHSSNSSSAASPIPGTAAES